MEPIQNNSDKQKTDDMLIQKTNEDFNNKKPNPNDPNEKKNSPRSPVLPVTDEGDKMTIEDKE